MNENDRIIIDSETLVGKPVIKGTRISVEFILELLANEWTANQILENYPQLKKEDVSAALDYSNEILN
jgi:uncharacterized protein (DUF433 family)